MSAWLRAHRGLHTGFKCYGYAPTLRWADGARCERPAYSPPAYRSSRLTLHNRAAATKKVRDACMVTKGEEFCKTEIDAHKACLREDGFIVP